jgi:mono/diheme cytochrome c family protein
MKIRKVVLLIVAVAAAAFLLIQLVPYGHAHDSPAVVSEPNWDSPQTQELARRACYDCHSNETVWPWYSNVAPVSWLVQHDVDEGREYLNFSLWGQGGEGEEAEELNEVLAEGQMPPSNYLITHPEARLTEAEKAALLDGFMHTTGGSAGGESGEEEGGE